MRINILIFFLCILVGQGCATAQKPTISPHPPNSIPIPLVGATGVAEPGDPAGPRDPGDSTHSPDSYGPPASMISPTYGPEPVKLRPVILVLGPGLARGFAYVGVFQALEDAKIPVGAILATEMGSLVGTLYAMSSSINQFEWGLLSFKESLFRSPKKFFSNSKSNLSDGKKLEEQLKQIFKNKDLSEAKIPIRIAIQNKESGVPVVLDHGKVTQIIRAAIANPEVFTPGDLLDNANQGNDNPRNDNPGEGVSAGSTRPFLITEAKNLGMGPIIVVDVLNSADEAPALDELKQADLVIRPNVFGIGYMDFQKRTDAAFQGKRAIIKNISEIRRLVGLPEIDSERSGNP